MADNIGAGAGGANFTEVLEIKVDVQKFKLGIEQVLQEYEAFRQKVQAPIAIGVGNVDGAALAKSLAQMSASLNDFQAHQAQVMNALTQTLVENSEKQAKAISDVFDRLNNKGINQQAAVNAANAGAQAVQGAVAKEVAAVAEGEEKKKKLWQLSELEQRKRFKELQDNPTGIKGLDDKEVDFLIRKTKQDALNRQKVDAVGEKEATLAKQVQDEKDRRVAKSLDDEQKALNRKFIQETNNEQKLQEYKESVIGKANDAEQKRLQKEFIDRTKNEDAIQQYRNQVIAKANDAEQKRLNQQFIDETKQKQSVVNAAAIQNQKLAGFEGQLSQREQSLQSVKSLSVATLNQVEAQHKAIVALEKEIALRREQVALQRKITNQTAAGDVQGAKVTGVDLNFKGAEVGKAASAATQAVNGLNNALKNTGEVSKGALGSFIDGIPRLVGQVVKFGLAWKALNAIIAGIGFVIHQIFIEPFVDGIKYLEIIQNRMTDIKEAMVENVVFSTDWAKNVQLAGKAAEYATRRIQDFAAKAALDPEKIEAGFKSLIQGGGLKLFNNDIDRAVESTAKLLSLLRARGVSDTNQRRFVQEINDLMTGHVKKTSAVLQVLGFSVEEWKKLRKEAEGTGTLYELIEERLSGANERIGTADQRWTDLTHQLKLYKNELDGAVATGLWEALISTLQDLAEWYRENRDTLLDIAKVAGEVVGQTAAWFLELSKSKGFIPTILEMFAHMAIYLQQFIQDIVTAAKLADYVVKKVVPDKEKAKKREDLARQTAEFSGVDLQGFAPGAVMGAGPDYNKPIFDGEDKAKTEFLNRMAVLRSKWAEEDSMTNENFNAIFNDWLVNSEKMSERLDKASMAIKRMENGESLTVKSPELKKADESLKQAEKKVAAALQLKHAADVRYDAAKKAAAASTIEVAGNKVAKSASQRKAEAANVVDAKKAVVSTTSGFLAAQKERKKVEDERRKLLGIDVIGDISKNLDQGEQGALRSITSSISAELAKIREVYDNFVNDVNLDEAKRITNAATASHRIIQIRKAELDEVKKVFDKQRGQVATTPGLNENQRSSALNTVNKQEADATRRINREITQEEIKLEQDRFNRRMARLQGSIELQRQSVQEEKKVLDDSLKDKLITETQYFDAKAQLDKQDHELVINLLKEEIDRALPGTVERINLQKQLASETQRYYAQVISDAKERIRIQEQELRATREYQKAVAELKSQEVETSNEVLGIFARSESEKLRLQNQVIDARIKATDVALKNAQAELEIALASSKTAEEQRKLRLEIERLNNERAKLKNQKVQIAASAGTGSSPETANPEIQRISARNELQRQANEAAKKIEELTGELEFFKMSIDSTSGTTDAEKSHIQELNEEIKKSKEKLAELNGVIEKITPSFGDAFKKFGEDIFGSKNLEVLQSDTATGMEKLAAGANAAATALNSIQGIVSQYEQGREQGGVLGGIGSLLSKGPVSDLLSAIPVVGAFVKPVGAILGFLGGMFTKAARKIANQIKKEIETTMKDFSLGKVNLKDTIAALQAERESAIRRLSSKKGGQKELDKILPGLDDQIAQLQKQADEIKRTFEEQLSILKVHGAELQNIFKTWLDINKQVKEYLDAGGSADNAAQFLSLSLEKYRDDLQKSINSGEQEAIQNAIELNDKLKERIQLIEDFKRAEFDLINQDAIERRQSGAVTRGQELTKLRQENEEKLKTIDSEIDLLTKKLDIEKTVYNISSDIDELHRRDEELTLQALQEQIDAYTEMRDIINGIVYDPVTGLWSLTEAIKKLLGIGDTNMNGSSYYDTHSAMPIGGCPDVDMFVKDGLQVRDVVVGDILDVLLESGEVTTAPVISTKILNNPCVMLYTDNGCEVIVSHYTPVTTIDGRSVMAPYMEGELIATDSGNGVEWLECHVREVGVRPVAFISLGGLTFAAGVTAGKRVYTHNMSKYVGQQGFQNDPYTYFASGGVVRRRTRAVVGEDGPEAVVPLPDGKRIPVMIDFTRLLKQLDGVITSPKNVGDNFTVGDINVTVSGNVSNPVAIGDAIAEELHRRSRYGWRK